MTLSLLDLAVHLRLAGLLLLLLAGMHFFFPKRFAWAAELARLSLLNRQIFVVHCLFIVLILMLMGILSLAFAPLLLERTPLATLVLGGLTLFWLARALAQFFLYSPRLWRGNRFNTTMHVLFSCLWAYLSGVYGTAWVTSLH